MPAEDFFRKKMELSCYKNKPTSLNSVVHIFHMSVQMSPNSSHGQTSAYSSFKSNQTELESQDLCEKEGRE